ncbi:glycosyltransferase family 1 protein [Mesobacillus foraminis]|uniref:glycosyltransferase family 1 protein n=1 Tax=Mesobacillus foraminis TaxID=279826 RepID=UPI001BE81DF6|nr:glycosyltransferase family 1 protein [Mesobacillus foraminis]MBT2758420.1 glycosyltransferase family 1 protein [Mesobacillus foraminis]
MGNPLRVLHVVVNMNRGGAETLLMNLYRNIDRSQVQFDFLTCKEGIFDKEILELGGKIHRIPYISEVGHYKYVKMLDSFFLHNFQYNIVHSHMDKMSGLVLRAAKRAGIPIRISHSHSTSSEGGLLAKVYKWYAGVFIKYNATNLLACSNLAAQWLYKNKASKARVLKNGIDCNKYRYSSSIRKKIRKELKIPDGCFVLGHVGRFSPPKNHSFIIDIFCEHSKKHPNTILILIGDGPLRSAVEEQVLEYGVEDKVRFLGTRSDVHKLLQAIDLFMFPSLYEGLPVTAIEAQGAGLPCLLANTITTEVDMGLHLVKFLPLRNKDLWIENIENILNKNKQGRNNSTTTLIQQGYNILDTSKELQNFYMEVVG